MGLFKKKEPREPRDDDSTFMKLWLNKKTHAMMVLGAYFVFFAILLIVINVSSPNTKNTVTNKEHLNKLFSNVSGKKYKFNHMITNNDKVYYFNGTNDNGIIIGKIIEDDKIINVKIENKECVVGTYNDNNEFVPAYEVCPSDLRYTNFIPEEIYETIKYLRISPTSLSDHYYIKLNDKVSYDVSFEKDDIKAIVIKDNDYTYQLRFNLVLNSDNSDTNVDTENINE